MQALCHSLDNEQCSLLTWIMGISDEVYFGSFLLCRRAFCSVFFYFVTFIAWLFAMNVIVQSPVYIIYLFFGIGVFAVFLALYVLIKRAYSLVLCLFSFMLIGKVCTVSWIWYWCWSIPGSSKIPFYYEIIYNNFPFNFISFLASINTSLLRFVN